MKAWIDQAPIVLDKAKLWLKKEVSEGKQTLFDTRDETACEEYTLLEGIVECAEALLHKIDQWEKE